MRFGYQKGFLTFRFNGKSVSIKTAEIFCVLLGVLLFLLAEFQAGQDPLQERYLFRNGYGQGEEKVQLLVEGLEEDAVEVEFPVWERQYTNEEAKAAIERLGNSLGERILGTNESLAEVRENLKLVSKDNETGFRIRWTSENTELVDTSGHVYGGQADAQKGSPVMLTAEILDGRGNSGTFPLPVRVFPPLLTEAEKRQKGLLEQIQDSEHGSREEAGFYLPGEYEGKALDYRRRDSGEHIWLLVLGPVLAVLLRARGKSEEKEQKKGRERKLLLDYSEVVSKLQIFLGAGMTVRTAWERIALDYQERRERGSEERPAYEEMLQTYYQLRSGTPEGKAYEEFGRRCVLQPYLKLAGLLEQNRKTGTKNLRQLLQLEMTDAFEQRKNLARRQGEEAATKLLVPLFFMLGVVMVIVAVPAFLTFYQ